MRSFIAIPIDKQTTKALKSHVEILKKTFHHHSIRWVPEQNYHLTLYFLGNDLQESQLEHIKNSMQNWFSEGMSFFEAEIINIKLFPNSNNPHTVVASLDSTIMMQYLVREIEDHLKPLGIQKAKHAFRPHISLGRLTKEACVEHIEIPAAQQTIEDLWLEVDTLTLYQSQLSQPDPIYTPIHSIKLERY